MKKSQLENGMVLLTRKGNAAIVFQTKEENLIIGVGSEVGGRFIKSDLDEDLKSSNPDFDIVKIYQLDNLENVVIKNIKSYIHEHNLIWEIEKPVVLKEFNQEVFSNSSEEIKNSFAGFDNYEKFRSHKEFYQLEVCTKLDGFEIENAKELFLIQIRKILNKEKTVEETRLRFCCENYPNQFAHSFHIKMNANVNPDKNTEESDILDLIFRTNDSRILDMLPDIKIVAISLETN